MITPDPPPDVPRNPNPHDGPQEDQLQKVLDGDANVDYKALLAQLDHDSEVLGKLEESYEAEAAAMKLLARQEQALLQAAGTGDRATVDAVLQQAEAEIKTSTSGDEQALHLRCLAKLKARLQETPLTWRERIRKAFGRPIQ